ncbi:DUF6531 domain-containing protein [Streptomyces doebereineriae]
MLLEQTDLDLPGVLPLVLKRTHLSDYTYGMWFGRSWASTLDERIEIDVRNQAMWAREDGTVLIYEQLPSPQTPEVMPLEGPRIALRRISEMGAQNLEFAATDPRTGWTRYFTKPGGKGWQLWLTTLEDRNGNQIDIHRDATGRPLDITHSGGYDIKVTGDHGRGRVTALSLRAGDGDESALPVVQFGYDEDGDPHRGHQLFLHAAALHLRHAGPHHVVDRPQRLHLPLRLRHGRPGRADHGTRRIPVEHLRLRHRASDDALDQRAGGGHPIPAQRARPDHRRDGPPRTHHRAALRRPRPVARAHGSARTHDRLRVGRARQPRHGRARRRPAHARHLQRPPPATHHHRARWRPPGIRLRRAGQPHRRHQPGRPGHALRPRRIRRRHGDNQHPRRDRHDPLRPCRPAHGTRRPPGRCHPLRTGRLRPARRDSWTRRADHPPGMERRRQAAQPRPPRRQHRVLDVRRRGQLHRPHRSGRRHHPLRVHALRRGRSTHRPGWGAPRLRVRRKTAAAQGDQPARADLDLPVRRGRTAHRGNRLRRPHPLLRPGRGRAAHRPHPALRRRHRLRARHPGPHGPQERR